MKRIQQHKDFMKKYKQTQDLQNRALVFKNILNDIMVVQRKNMVDLYNLYRKDFAFQDTFSQTLENLIEMEEV